MRMIRQHASKLTLVSVAMVCLAVGCQSATQGPSSSAAEDFARETSEVPRTHPDVFEVNRAALAFVGKHRNKEAVSFLLAEAQTAGNKSVAQLAAFLGLAHLADVADTVRVLASFLEDKNAYRAEAAFLAFSFLPPDKARDFAEKMALDASAPMALRSKFMLLLRGVGDAQVLQKLRSMPVSEEAGPWLARRRTVDSLERRFAVKAAEAQEAWAHQELVLLQVSCWTPNFQVVSEDYTWAARRLAAHGEHFSEAFLQNKLSLREVPHQSTWDWDVRVALPICEAMRRITQDAAANPTGGATEP